MGFRKVYANIQPPGLEKPDSPLFSIRLLPQRRGRPQKPCHTKRGDLIGCRVTGSRGSKAPRSERLSTLVGFRVRRAKSFNNMAKRQGTRRRWAPSHSVFEGETQHCILRKRLHNANRIVAGHTEADDQGKQVNAVNFPARGCPAGQCSINRRAPRKRRSDSGGEASRSPGRFRILYRTCS